MKKKIFGIIATTSLLALAACSNGDTETNGDGEEVKTVTLALWNKDQEPVLREILDNFEAENDDIKVELELTPNPQYWTKLEAAATGAAMADIVWMNGPNFINYASNGVIEPINEYLENSDVDLANYPESLVNLYTYNDEVYGIPKDWDTTALWYNEDLFDAAGVDYPTNDWTFEDLEQAAAQLTDESAGVWGIAANYGTQEGMYNVIPQNGGYVINEERTQSGYDMPESIEALEKYVGLIESGVSPSLEVQTDTAPRDLFASGKLAMVYAASWNIPVFVNSPVADSINLVEMPAMSQKGAVIHGLIYALNAKSENKDEAFRVIEYLASEEANEHWAASGAVIPAYEGALDTWLNFRPDYNLEAYVNSLEYSVPFPISARSSVWNQFEADAINDMYTGTRSVEETMTELGEKMNEALDAE